MATLFMTTDDPIPPEMPCFDDLGQPCAVTEPAVYDEPLEPEPAGLDVEQFIIAAVSGAADVRQIGENVLLTAYLLKLDGAPGNLRDLGFLLGVSHTMAGRKVSNFCRRFRREMGEMVSKRPVSNE